MKSRLINVRLDDERLNKVRLLRERGVALSDLVRQAIDEKFEALSRRTSSRELKALVEEIFERYPDPPHLPPRDVDVHDAAAARAAIRGKLSRKRG